MHIEPRDVIGTPEPGPGRPLLLLCCRLLLVHYTGVPDRPGLPELTQARNAAHYGVSAGKPWEYNYMIGAEGTVFEQAGAYLAAHCLLLNRVSIGVLFLIGVGGSATTEAASSLLELRRWLVSEGRLLPDHEVAPHYRYRATSCPGPLAEPPGGRLGNEGSGGRAGDVLEALRPQL